MKARFALLALLAAIAAFGAVAWMTGAPLATSSQAGSWMAIPNNAYVTIDGNTFVAECGPDPRAIQQLGDVVHFQMIPGNGWPEDASEAERVELDGYKQTMAPGKVYWAAWSIYIDPGAWSTSDWLAMEQIPGLWGHMISKGARSFSFFLGRQPSPLARIPIEQGVWYHFVEKYVVGPKGSMASWVNGKQVVDYTGPIGAGGSYYPKLGIYRGTLTAAGAPVTETIGARYANFKFGTQDLSALIASPTPPPALVEWP